MNDYIKTARAFAIFWYIGILIDMEKYEHDRTMGVELEKTGGDWQNPNIFEMYEQGRRLVREATAEAVASIFRHNIDTDSNGSILELGSGIGELSKLVSPEYKERLVGLEQTESFSQLQKINDPTSRAVVGKIESLPIASDSTDAVVSFSVFDTLTNLETAFQEVRRVLKPGGRFVHILDLGPNIHVIMDQLPKGFIPFPDVEGSHMSGWQLVRNGDYQKLREKLPPEVVPIADIYAKDPAFAIQFILERAQNVGVELAKSIKAIRDVEIETRPPIKESFAENMRRALESSGMMLVSDGDVWAEKIVQRNAGHDKYPGSNYFENNVGKLSGGFRSELVGELGHNQVKTKSILHVFVAEKPETKRNGEMKNESEENGK